MTEPFASSLRVLLADSDDNARHKLRIALEGTGCTVVGEATSAREALTLARQTAPDVAIFEATFPDGEGTEAAEQVQCERIAPVLLLTAYQADIVRQAAKSGVYSYLVKPFEITRLLSALEIARSEWQATQALERKLQSLQEKDEARAMVDCAKRILMATCGVPELRAYRMIQARSMNTGRSMRVIAEAILHSHDVQREVFGESTKAGSVLTSASAPNRNGNSTDRSGGKMPNRPSATRTQAIQNSSA